MGNRLAVPRTRLLPAQPEGFVVVHGDVELLVFDVPASDGPVRVDGDGFPLRMGDRTVQASESQIQALKLHGFAESWESRPSPMTLADLDPELLARAREGTGRAAWSNEEYLLARKLADRRGRGLVLRRAAELVFAQHGPDHPNAGVRIFRVIGQERRFGPEHNVEERPRVEGPLARVIDEAIGTVDSLLRRPSRMVGNRFREVPEYPEFSWKEALLNALAHRDYDVEGASTEVWLFEDRMEVTSPGGLFADVRLEDLLARRKVHRSRNPRLMRVLVDLGAVRDQDEGIPRIFAEMEGLFLPEPTIEVDRLGFRVTLRNTPTLSVADRSFISSLGAAELSDQEFRALLHAHRHGRVDDEAMRQISGLDTLAASRMLGRLRDRGLLLLRPAGAASFYALGLSIQTAAAGIADTADSPRLGADSPGLGADGPGLGADSPGLDLPEMLQQAVAGLGSKPRKQRLWPVIEALCAHRPMSPAELARILGLRDPRMLVRRHLNPGLYEQLVTSELKTLLDDPHWVAQVEALGTDTAPDLLAQHLFEAARRALGGIGDQDRIPRQFELVNRLPGVLSDVAPDQVEASDTITPQILLSLLQAKQVGLGQGRIPRPGIPLRHSELIVNGPRDLHVGLEIARELPSADRVDLLMSFVKWNGFVELREALAAFCARGPRCPVQAGGRDPRQLRPTAHPAARQGLALPLKQRLQHGHHRVEQPLPRRPAGRLRVERPPLPARQRLAPGEVPHRLRPVLGGPQL